MEIVNLKAEKHLFLTSCPSHKISVLILQNGLNSRREGWVNTHHGIKRNEKDTTHIIKIPTEQAKKTTPGVSVYTRTSWLSVRGSLQGRGPDTSRGEEQESLGQPLTSFSVPDWCEAEWQGVLNSPLRTGTWLFFLTASGSERKDEVRWWIHEMHINQDSCYDTTKQWVLYLKGAHKGLVHAHHAACVVKLPAVVWGREQRHQLSFGKELVAVFNNLVAGLERKQLVDPQKIICYHIW